MPRSLRESQQQKKNTVISSTNNTPLKYFLGLTPNITWVPEPIFMKLGFYV
jgi:hypothetical protein